MSVLSRPYEKQIAYSMGISLTSLTGWSVYIRSSKKVALGSNPMDLQKLDDS